MKIIHTADWHIGKSLNDYSLLEDQKYYFERFVEKLGEIKPDALIIAGDLYDRSVPSSEAISLLNDILYKIVIENKIETFIVSGNHDSRERLSFGSELLEKSGLHIAGKIGNEIKKVSYKAANFYLLPYLEPHNVKMLYPEMQIKTFDEAMKIYTEGMLNGLDKSCLNILVSHGLFGVYADSDAVVGGSEMVDASIFLDFDYVALGHLHSYRTAGDKKMVFSGSPLKYSIDEAGQVKSFTVLSIEKGSFTSEQISIKPLHDIRILEGSFEFLLTRDSFLNNPDILEDYVFMNITDEKITLNAISKLKAVFPNITGLKYINLNQADISGFIKDKAQVSKQSGIQLFEEFFKDITNKDMSNIQKEYIASVFSTSAESDFSMQS